MRHRWSFVALGASLCAASLTQCSLTNDLDALGAGSHDGGRDGAAAAVDASGSAGEDGGATDGAPLPGRADAGADAGDGGGALDAADAADAGPIDEPPVFVEAGVNSWCNGRNVTFCADFDKSPLPSGFTTSEGAYVSLTSTLPSSPNNDLLLFVPPQSGGGTLSSKLGRSFTQAITSSVELGFDIYPERLNATPSGMLFAALDFMGNANAKYSVRLAFNEGSARVEESYLGFPTDVFHPSFVLPPSTWSRVRVSLVFGGDAAPSTLAVYVNDAIQGTTETLAPPAAVDARPTLLIGAVYGTLPHTGWTLRYDNVTLDIH